MSFSSIVEPAAHLLTLKIAEITHLGRIGFEAIGDDRLGPSVILQCLLEEVTGRLFIQIFGDIALENLTFVIDCSPKVWVSPLILTNTSSICQRQFLKPRIRLIRSLS